MEVNSRGIEREFQPLVSIVTPSYNASSFIKETIQSVQSQTYKNWEMIIIDDVSKDNTCELIKEEIKKDNRIRLIELQENGGPAIARNTGITNAKAKYVAFLDSDDLWLPEKLEKQLAFMQKNDIAFSFTSYQIMNQDGSPTDKAVHVPEKINYGGLLKNTIIGCLTVMLDIEKLGKVQMPNIRTRQDTATWLKILKQGHYAYGLDEILSKYRKVENSISSKKFKMAKMNWKLYREIEGLSIPKSAWCFVNYALNGVVKHFVK
ncbi:Putative teichuronic acid biosynthesis glycosyltransferase TuaG (plasmid) [Bacillus cereus]|uniref:glycosyltransferase family 2 protein n=1 Tax=Bacillus cereus group TaxID=86661 RepID=UPI0007449BD7|nr:MULTISPECIES: glycosyltransferase family 2 protein [Bacillus cereus group]ALZ64655.1 Putative teichuronic acid biosynthesis glycosyltransferase TuaG [Bacillus cereus]MEC2395135.1 glycosyltransferase family 2 protein [Bacillus toyonensis]OTX33678.1 glycosyl transferase [Bacillus thuringiensis serovar malayensis]OUB08506.1 glycosyl transferase [Bacillus thuringiensis serovar shandongiensis]